NTCETERGKSNIRNGTSSAQPASFIKEQITRSLAVLYGQRREGPVFEMEFQHALKIDRGDDVHVVQDERLIRSAFEKPSRSFEPASGVQQHFLARNLNVQAEVMVRLQIVHHHVGEMMDVNDDVADPVSLQSGERDFQ